MCISRHSLSLFSIWWGWQPPRDHGFIQKIYKYTCESIQLLWSLFSQNQECKVQLKHSAITMAPRCRVTARDGIYALLKFYLPWASGLLSDWCTFVKLHACFNKRDDCSFHSLLKKISEIRYRRSYCVTKWNHLTVLHKQYPLGCQFPCVS